MIYGNPLIFGGSGGGGDTYAFIVVTYPAGSTCTASDGTSTLSAPDTSGSWVCKVPNAGTWVVSCTDGTDTASTTVSITTEGQREAVELAYNFYIVQNGVLKVADWTLARGSSTQGGVFQQSGYVEFTTEGSNINIVAATTNPVNLSEYRTLRLTIADTGKSYYSSAKVPVFGIGDTRPTGNGSSSGVSGFDYYKMLNTASGNIPAGTYDIDVSALSGNYYIAVSLSDSINEFPKAFINVTEFVLLK